jgi:membrane fusion protein (multidrug efflux system)
MQGDQRERTSKTAAPSGLVDGTALWVSLHEEQLRVREELTALRAEQSELRAARGKDAGAAKTDESDGGKATPDEASEAEATPGDHPQPPLRTRASAFVRAHRLVLGIAIALLVASIVGGVLLVRYLGSYESTDDAQIDGDISAISGRVSGTVLSVRVVDSQHVDAGDVLAELDSRDYEVALAQARAALAQAEAEERAESPSVAITTVTSQTNVSTTGVDVSAAKSERGAGEKDVEAADAKLAEAQANDRVAQVERVRAERLLASGAIAQAELDRAVAQADAATAALASARAGVAAASRKVEELRSRVGHAVSRLEEVKSNAPRQVAIREATLAARKASTDAARAALAQAELNMQYTRIVAPVSGIIGKKSVNVGDHVQPGQQLLAVVQTGRLWVTANYKETQLREMHPGQRVTLAVDAFGTDLRGEVDNLAGASGARYSLLPPENATGNFVKVVQRLPVRITLDPNQPGADRLRPGMSVEPKVWLR